tara:strand:- start:244 stop:1269 length:1026 start_codon:yes stop_codon:yes gene_type:complete
MAELPRRPQDAILWWYKRNALKAGGVWCASWRPDGEERKRHSFGTADREVAERALIDFKKLHHVELIVIDDIMAAYFEEKSHTSLHTAHDVIRYEAKVRPTFGHIRPEQIDKQFCRHYTEARRFQGVKNGTVAKELATVRAAINWHNPRNRAVFQLPPADKPRERYLTREEFRAVLDGAHAFHIKLFLILGISTGARASAITELTWSRVHFDKGIIRFPLDDDEDDGKRRKPRAVVPMTNSAREALLEAQRAAMTPYVIEYRGEKIKSAKIGVKRAATRVGVEGFSPHVLRHSAAVWMAEAGSTMPEIAQYLGHTDSRITERVYAKFSPEFLSKAATALEI